jgi:hypothetical protein
MNMVKAFIVLIFEGTEQTAYPARLRRQDDPIETMEIGKPTKKRILQAEEREFFTGGHGEGGYSD